jgi:hypothetical protein
VVKPFHFIDFAASCRGILYQCKKYNEVVSNSEMVLGVLDLCFRKFDLIRFYTESLFQFLLQKIDYFIIKNIGKPLDHFYHTINNHIFDIVYLHRVGILLQQRMFLKNDDTKVLSKGILLKSSVS